MRGRAENGRREGREEERVAEAPDRKKRGNCGRRRRGTPWNQNRRRNEEKSYDRQISATPVAPEAESHATPKQVRSFFVIFIVVTTGVGGRRHDDRASLAWPLAYSVLEEFPRVQAPDTPEFENKDRKGADCSPLHGEPSIPLDCCRKP